MNLAERNAEIVRLRDEGVARIDIRRRLGVTRSIVDNALRTLPLPPASRDDLPASRALAPVQAPRPPENREEFVASIVASYGAATQAIITVGLLLIEAKRALAHGEFEAMVDADLPFTPSTARRLMAIARDDWIRAHGHVLPPSWRTLYEVHKLDEETREARLADGTINPDMQRRDIAQVRKATARAVNHELLARQVAPLPDKRFCVAVEDFEWDFEVWSRATGMDRHAGNHYPTAEHAHTAEEIVAHSAARLRCLADDCLLAMWVPVPHLDKGLDVLRLRGFRYVTSAVWVKHLPKRHGGAGGMGMGLWLRVDHELLLFGLRGTRIRCPSQGTAWRSVFLEPASGEHSRKTEEPLAMLEMLFPELFAARLFVELNRRGAPRPGWAAWGNEAVSGAAGESEAEWIAGSGPAMTTEGDGAGERDREGAA